MEPLQSMLAQQPESAHQHSSSPSPDYAITIPQRSVHQHPFGCSTMPAPPPSGEYPYELNVHDALAYLEMVRLAFVNQPGMYDEFQAVLRRFNLREIARDEVIIRAKQLFWGRKELLIGFAAFLTPEDAGELVKEGLDEGLLRGTEKRDEEQAAPGGMQLQAPGHEWGAQQGTDVDALSWRLEKI
ncbi:hypothetical protein CALVIDRAFT_555112 [Calocera viscosa TUFC12733]|uniref:Uncharacterized protein n=1 Tax=Calocera viscosa (strain TUFC12733) TaxID=1330018 RepID=A0A167M5H7_CALVF|nr:hypothetical protein CALVIDRAFT_555112 [Calocera viscosa TUFC12733]